MSLAPRPQLHLDLCACSPASITWFFQPIDDWSTDHWATGDNGGWKNIVVLIIRTNPQIQVTALASWDVRYAYLVLCLRETNWDYSALHNKLEFAWQKFCLVHVCSIPKWDFSHKLLCLPVIAWPQSNYIWVVRHRDHCIMSVRVAIYVFM
jgi:hypothetical protein